MKKMKRILIFGIVSILLTCSFSFNANSELTKGITEMEFDTGFTYNFSYLPSNITSLMTGKIHFHSRESPQFYIIPPAGLHVRFRDISYGTGILLAIDWTFNNQTLFIYVYVVLAKNIFGRTLFYKISDVNVFGNYTFYNNQSGINKVASKFWTIDGYNTFYMKIKHKQVSLFSIIVYLSKSEYAGYGYLGWKILDKKIKIQ